MQYVLGVEFKGNQLKIAAFRKSRGELELIKLDAMLLSAMADETTTQLTSWIATHLPERTSVKAVLTISESALYLKELEFPNMLDEKMNEAVYWEIPTVAPISQSDAVFDWQTVTKGKGVQRVLVVVGKSYLMESLISAFRNAGVEIVAIEPSSYALARMVNVSFGKPTLVCVVEEQGADYIVFKKGLPVFASSVSGQSHVNKIAQLQNSTDLTADIANEGNKLISYWQSKESEAIQQVLVTGDLIYKYLGLTPLNLFSPLPTFMGTVKKTKQVRTDSYQDLEKASYLIAIGAGARHAQNEVLEGINLFPVAEKEKSEKLRAKNKQTAQIMGYAIANTVILILILASIAAGNLWWYSLEKHSMALSNTLASQSPTALVNEVKSTNAAIQNMIVLSNRQVNSGDRLNRISALIPQTLKLTQITVSRDKSEKWQVEGEGDRESVLVYQKKLADETGAKQVELDYSSLNKNTPDNEFKLTIIW